MSDPRRILDGGADPELEALFRAGADERLDPEQRARLVAGVGAGLASGLQPKLGQELPSTGLTLAGKGMVLALVLGAGALGIASLRSGQTPRALSPPAPARHVATEPATSVAADQPSVAHQTSPPPPVGAADTPTESKSRPPRLSRRDDLARGRAVDSGGELELLRRCRRELEHAPRKALALAEQHRRQFTHGILAQERELLAIEALLRIGDRPAALGRAERFEHDFPDSAHRRRLSVMLGTAQRSIASGADTQSTNPTPRR